MDAFSLRLASDRARLDELEARSHGKVRVLRVPSASHPTLELELAYRTADSAAYPSRSRNSTRLVIDFPGRYPFVTPTARITTPILHPNVWETGVVCLGAKWIASEGIDLFVLRIARLVSFDPLLVNEQSAANRQALVWYQRARRDHPGAFPSDTVHWLDAPARVVECPRCAGKLRLPGGRRGTVVCPRCQNEFEART